MFVIVLCLLLFYVCNCFMFVMVCHGTTDAHYMYSYNLVQCITWEHLCFNCTWSLLNKDNNNILKLNYLQRIHLLAVTFGLLEASGNRKRRFESLFSHGQTLWSHVIADWQLEVGLAIVSHLLVSAVWGQMRNVWRSTLHKIYIYIYIIIFYMYI